MTIPNHFDKNSIFFKKIVKTEVIKEIKHLDIKKRSLSSDIPTKIIKEFSDKTIFNTKNFNLCLNKWEFTEILIVAKVTPVSRKAKSSFKEDNYRPISILSNISKIYERIMHNQINDFFINKLSKYQYDFRKGFGTQHCL